MSERLTTIIEKTNDEFIKNDLRPFLQIPSNTLNTKGIQKAKQFILDYIREICDEVTELEGKISPLFLGKISGKSEKTLLIYMMYDTQPVYKTDKWICEPFSGDITQLPAPLDSLGDCIIARGAYNSKSPLLCFLNTIKLLKKEKALPISLLLLFDGEEEKGSPTLLQTLETKQELFKGCMGAYYPAAKQDLNGNAVLKLGYKGILSLTLHITTPNKEPHSAFSGMIPNPASELVNLLTKIYSNSQFQIDSLKQSYELSKEDQKILDQLYAILDLEKIKKKAGIRVTRFKDLEKDFEHYLFSPTFNISTLRSGFLGEGIKNFTPNEAFCNIDIRFAHNIKAQQIFKEIKEIVSHYSNESSANIKLIKHIGYKSSRVQRNSLLVKNLIHGLENFDIDIEIWPISAAAAPLSKIQNILGFDFIVGGMGIGGYAHQMNEFIQLKSIIKMRLLYYYFLNNF
ncbi:MAG: M20/M25/M40 family metallo-hydrolase [Promethearchaeia archaeon]